MVTSMEALPADIIVNITSRLSVKSIISCTLVCKFFKTLIPNPFLAKHNPTYFLLCNENKAKFSILDFDYDDRRSVSKDQVIDMKPSFPGYHTRFDRMIHADEKITIFGSCNDLVCFSQSFMNATLNIYLYNPVLGKSVTVPKPSLNPSPNTISERYAFGFCPVTNHYKVLRFLSRNSNGYRNAEVEIYTIGSGRWRHIGQVPKGIWTRSSPICVRGSFYWIWSKKDGKSIFTFDLATERFGSSPPPPIETWIESMFALGCMDHCLVATVGSDQIGSDLDIWKRKEGTWSKNWVLHNTNGICNFRGLVPLAISADGIILMNYPFGRQLYCFDPKGKCDTPHVIKVPRLRSVLVPIDATLMTCPTSVEVCSKNRFPKKTVSTPGSRRRITG